MVIGALVLDLVYNLELAFTVDRNSDAILPDIVTRACSVLIHHIKCIVRRHSFTIKEEGKLIDNCISAT